MIPYKNLLFCFLILCATFYVLDLQATHNRAGEITYAHAPLEGELYRFEFTITTYTKIDGESGDADRDFLTLRFGDGTTGTLPRVNGPGNNGEIIVTGLTKKNIYQGFHTYGGPSTYIITMEDPNRIDKIININGGESVQIPFVIVDTLFMPQPDFFGFNNSPILNQAPIDYANRGYPFIHNPNAVDIDGDSLHFQLITPLTLITGSVPTQVPNYQLPQEVSPQIEFLPPSGNLPPNNEYQLDINHKTGEIVWDSPWQPGLYNIAILINEYRNGVKMGAMVRDMQIEVLDNDNDPPEITSLNDTCITVNDLLEFTVDATDVNEDNLTMSANGLPFSFENSPAIFTSSVTGPGSISGQFSWVPDCDAILSQPYSLVFKVEDDYFEDNQPLPLADLETWNIQVIAPAPNAVTTAVFDGTVLVSWGNNYVCSDSEKFIGFSVWRKMGCDSLRVQDCGETPESLGYELLESGLQTFSYGDNTTIAGVTYSYAITAEFADIFTGGGIPINFSISLLSDASCTRVPSKIPLMYNVDITSTDPANGNIYVEWSRPLEADLDLTESPGPYKYVLFRDLNGSLTEVFDIESPTFVGAVDTFYSDTGVDTENEQYNYLIEFYSNENLLGTSQEPSSVRLSAISENSGIDLSWNAVVPWSNISSKVYRRLESQATYSLIDEVNTQAYKDDNVSNGIVYCYYVATYGSYFTTELKDPLINKSQEICIQPIDTEAPCNPDLTVSNDCDEFAGAWDYINILTWFVSEECLEDVAGYRLYYKPVSGSEYEIIFETSDPGAVTYIHELDENTLSGCYKISAFDGFDNESDPINEICVDPCFVYELPNTFTPNGDNMNDIFLPIEGYKFVSQVDFQVFNRWGNLLYETNDPNLLWDGSDQNSKEPLPTGVYFYTLDVIEEFGSFRQTLGSLSGYIHLIRE